MSSPYCAIAHFYSINPISFFGENISKTPFLISPVVVKILNCIFKSILIIWNLVDREHPRRYYKILFSKINKSIIIIVELFLCIWINIICNKHNWCVGWCSSPKECALCTSQDTQDHVSTFYLLSVFSMVCASFAEVYFNFVT